MIWSGHNFLPTISQDYDSPDHYHDSLAALLNDRKAEEGFCDSSFRKSPRHCSVVAHVIPSVLFFKMSCCNLYCSHFLSGF